MTTLIAVGIGWCLVAVALAAEAIRSSRIAAAELDAMGDKLDPSSPDRQVR